MKSTLIKSAIALLTAGSVVAAQATAQFPTSPPEAAEPKGFELPRTETYSLRNGLDVTLVPFGNVPKVTIRATIRVGNLNDGDQPWMADFTGDMLEEGAAGESATAIAEMAAAMGGSLGVGVGLDQSTVAMDVLSENAPDAIGLMADVLQRPDFPEDSFDKVQQNILRRLSIAGSQPGSLADDAFLTIMYPGHPYANAVLPPLEQVQSYTLDDVKTFYAENFGAARTHIYVVGQFNKRQVKRAIRQAFRSWDPGADPLMLVPGESSQNITIVERPGAVQSTLRLGKRIPPVSEEMALQVANTMLGGYFSSRITKNIREDKGYTYSPFSQNSYELGAGYWAQNADVTTEVTGASLTEIVKEIEGLRTEAPSEEELQGVKNYMGGIFVLRLAGRGGVASQLGFVNLHGLGESYLEGYVERVAALTPEDIQKAAIDELAVRDMSLVVVGDPGAVRSQMADVPAFADRLPDQDGE